MPLFTILLTLAFERLWGAANPVQRDEWYWRWLNVLGTQGALAERPVFKLALAVGVPVFGLLVVMGLLSAISAWLLLPLGVLVLLYSLGRGTTASLEAYTSAYAVDDWPLANAQAASLGVDVEGLTEHDWQQLHANVLEAVAYRRFEAVFPVLFWFLLLGPAGALLYRLSALYQCEDEPEAAHWLWLLEWPAVRLLGLSFAVTGNFDACWRRWSTCVTAEGCSSAEVVYESAMGALSASEELEPPQLDRRELVGLSALYRRTYWLWLGLVGAWAILY